METSKLKRILGHLEKADKLLNEYSREDQDKILEMHSYEGCLPRCLRSGRQAAEELIKEYRWGKGNVKGAK